MKRLKRVVNWGAYYFTQEGSYYPIPEHSMTLTDVTGNTGLLPHLKPIWPLTHFQKLQILDWAIKFGICLHQKSARDHNVQGGNSASQYVDWMNQHLLLNTCSGAGCDWDDWHWVQRDCGWRLGRLEWGSEVDDGSESEEQRWDGWWWWGTCIWYWQWIWCLQWLMIRCS